ncbi:hypothetical protein ADUPG1_010525, partial [Aduncisulcus paluster]
MAINDMIHVLGGSSCGKGTHHSIFLSACAILPSKKIIDVLSTKSRTSFDTDESSSSSSSFSYPLSPKVCSPSPADEKQESHGSSPHRTPFIKHITQNYIKSPNDANILDSLSSTLPYTLAEYDSNVNDVVLRVCIEVCVGKDKIRLREKSPKGKPPADGSSSHMKSGDIVYPPNTQIGTFSVYYLPDMISSPSYFKQIMQSVIPPLSEPKPDHPLASLLPTGTSSHSSFFFIGHSAAQVKQHSSPSHDIASLP